MEKPEEERIKEGSESQEKSAPNSAAPAPDSSVPPAAGRSKEPESGVAAMSTLEAPAVPAPAVPVESAPPPPGQVANPAGGEIRAAYEHPWAVRFCHWLNAISIFVMVTSGLQIFYAFPSFGPRVPEKDLFNVPRAIRLGGWLGGALQWHFTFMWIFAGTGIFYLLYQLISGHYKTVLFTPKDIPGVWPMVRHYFLFGPNPPATGQYNALQKLAYTVTVLLGVASVLTGAVIYKPVQFSALAWLMGGFHLARVWHFAAMCGFLAFLPGHLLMVALHGWNNFYSMLAGWKKNPEYLAD